ncbi:hypothetical protein EFS13_04790 [Lentilactobacillus buchneri]|nr:hypothetical protein [Lentilactobacillus buchneri]MCT3548257.1 hypothetical protein [Lentilactobacillus buchneri]MCT3554865.1 hypothetical protein [Lentilactobacillus buchneri]MCT3556472.1 hypothetical protein [Lentilactobacillus buchneri]MCT3559278.1 hypothetical protein [Lentilactobacillus buchneri]
MEFVWFWVGAGVAGGGACWWSFLVVFLLCIGYFVVPFSLVEMCSLGQQPASKELQTKIKLDFRSKHLRLRLLTAPVRTLIETCSEQLMLTCKVKMI